MRDRHLRNILEGDPSLDSDNEVIEAELDPADFENIDIENIMDQEADASPDNPDSPTASSEDAPADPTDENTSEDTETDPETLARKKEAEKVKKEIIQNLIEPETIVEFFDMGMSRLGTLVKPTKKDDWALDDQEKDIIAKLLHSTVEEEGIKFWPSWAWLLIVVIFSYAMKGFDIYDDYYSEEGLKRMDPSVRSDEDIKKMERETDAEEKHLQAVLARKMKLKAITDQIDQVDRDIAASGAGLDGLRDKYTPETPEASNGSPGWVTEANQERDKYPEDWFVRDEKGNRVKTKQGLWRLKPNVTRNNMNTRRPRNEKGKFMSDLEIEAISKNVELEETGTPDPEIEKTDSKGVTTVSFEEIEDADNG